MQVNTDKVEQVNTDKVENPAETGSYIFTQTYLSFKTARIAYDNDFMACK